MTKINAKGLICPEPIMLLHQAIHESRKGDIVELIATDPTAVRDVKKFCEFLNHSLISYNLIDDLHVFKVKKGT